MKFRSIMKNRTYDVINKQINYNEIKKHIETGIYFRYPSVINEGR